MDERVRDHAEVIVDHSTGIEADDNVLLEIPPAAQDLAEAIAELVGARGATLYTAYGNNPHRNDPITRNYLQGAETDEIETPEHQRELYKTTDVVIFVRGERNVTEWQSVSPSVHAAYQQAFEPLMGELLDGRSCATQYPTASFAQLAEMSTDAYEDFVWDAINKDWDAQREHQAQLVELLDGASEIRIQSGDTTDIRASIDGMPAANDYGERNLPGGEVYTAPVVDSIEGQVLFDIPIYHEGREIENAHLTFEDGEVIAHDADRGTDVLAEILETDPGARRVGELGFGMNRDIDRFTHNILFDEKMGDTIHLALGHAYEWTVGENRKQNESAVHVDLIVDMSENARIEIDGELVQQNGYYVFEDGFEL